MRLLQTLLISSPRFFSFSYVALTGLSSPSTVAIFSLAISRRSLLAASFSRSKAWISTSNSSLRLSSLSIASGAVSC